MNKKIILIALVIVLIASVFVIKPNSLAVSNSKERYETADKEEVGEENEWKHTFELPKYDENGKIIVYKVDEWNVPETYTKTTEGNTIRNTLNNYNYRVEYYYDDKQDETKTEFLSAPYGSTINDYIDKNMTGYVLQGVVGLGLTISNNEEENVIRVQYETEKTILSGTKIWKDDNNSQGLRPEGYTLKLYADGNLLKENYFTQENWIFIGLPKYNYETGEPIYYTVQEDEIILENGDKYVPTINGTQVINTLTGTTQIEVKKEWDDYDNMYNTRPEKIILMVEKMI